MLLNLRNRNVSLEEAVTLSGVAKASLYRDVCRYTDKVMFHLQVTSATMELHLLVCVFLLTWSGTTFGQQNSKKTNYLN